MKRLFSFGISAAMSAVIAVLLLVKMPDQVSMPRVINGDKYIHAFLFLLLAWAVYHDAKKAKFRQWAVCLIAAVWSAFLGGAMELLQQYATSYRTGSWWDWVADLIGISMGIALCISLQTAQLRQRDDSQ